MALDYEVDNLDSVDESLRGLYVEKDGKHILDVSGIDTGEEARKALASQRQVYNNDTSKLKKALAEKEKAIEEIERSKLEKNSEFEELWKKEKDGKQELKEQVLKLRKESIVSPIVASLTTNEEKAGLLSGVILKYIEVDNDSLTASLKGFSDKKELIAHLKEDYPFLVDGSKATGGGAKGGGEGGAPQKEMSRTDFDALSEPKKREFISKGGKVK